MAQTIPKLKLFDITMIVTSLVIGMGIFRTPASVAKEAGPPIIFFGVWIFAGIISFLGALTFAEVGSRYPVHGGFYNILSEAFNPQFAFSINWMVLISNAASTAAVILAGSDYLLKQFYNDNQNIPGLVSYGLCIGVVLILFFINWLGLRLSATMQNVLMLLKIAMLAIIIFSPLLMPKEPEEANSILPNTSLNLLSLFAFFKCFQNVFFTYGGYQQVVNFGADMPNANKILPKSLLYGFSLILIIYLFVNIGYYHSLGMQGLANTKTPAADIVKKIFGNEAFNIFSILMFFCVVGYVNVSMLSNPRVYFAMAQNKLLPKVFANMHLKTQVPRGGLILFSALILMTLFITNEFDKIVNVVMFFDSLSFMSLAASIFIFRKRNTAIAGKPFKIWGYPIVPALFIITYAAVVVSVFAKDYMALVYGVIVFGIGMLVYYFQNKIKK